MGISDELQKVGVMQLIPVCLYFVAHAFQSELKKNIYIYSNKRNSCNERLISYGNVSSGVLMCLTVQIVLPKQLGSMNLHPGGLSASVRMS